MHHQQHALRNDVNYKIIASSSWRWKLILNWKILRLMSTAVHADTDAVAKAAAYLQALEESLARPWRCLEVGKERGAEGWDGRKGAGWPTKQRVSNGKGPCQRHGLEPLALQAATMI